MLYSRPCSEPDRTLRGADPFGEVGAIGEVDALQAKAGEVFDHVDGVATELLRGCRFYEDVEPFKAGQSSEDDEGRRELDKWEVSPDLCDEGPPVDRVFRKSCADVVEGDGVGRKDDRRPYDRRRDLAKPAADEAEVPRAFAFAGRDLLRPCRGPHLASRGATSDWREMRFGSAELASRF